MKRTKKKSKRNGLFKKPRARPSKLTAKQRQAGKLVAYGFDTKTVASKVRATPGTVRVWRASTNFKRYVARTKKDMLNTLTEKLKSVAIHAVDTLNELMDHNDPRIRLDAVDRVLDIGGGNSPFTLFKEKEDKNSNTQPSIVSGSSKEEIIDAEVEVRKSIEALRAKN